MRVSQDEQLFGAAGKKKPADGDAGQQCAAGLRDTPRDPRPNHPVDLRSVAPAMSDYARCPVQGPDTAGLPVWFFVRLLAPSPAYLDAHIRSGSSSFWASRDRRG